MEGLRQICRRDGRQADERGTGLWRRHGCERDSGSTDGTTESYASPFQWRRVLEEKCLEEEWLEEKCSEQKWLDEYPLEEKVVFRWELSTLNLGEKGYC